MISPVKSNDKQLAFALERLEKLKKQHAFDPMDLNSVATPKQQEVFDDFGKYSQYWIRAGNQSGKSQTCARILTWVILGTHPTWTRPESWGDEPILAVVAGRNGKQIENSLLPKIKSYLESGTYKEVRQGGAIQTLELNNGAKIIFQSLENPNVARERLQSYVAHITWVDEMPPILSVIREILIRTQARRGYNLFSFTPTIVSLDVQKFVDAVTAPEGKLYRFSMLDNPLYKDPARRQELISRYAHMPADIQKAIFEGDWITSDEQVYHFSYEKMVGMPEGYSPMWRHIEAVDPAISSATGLTIWAENPVDSKWYCVLAKYIKGIQVPTDIVKAVQAFTQNVNIIRRTSDYAPWYVNTASSMGIQYMTIESKNANRKEELIKNFQEALGTRIMLSPGAEDLITEIQDCRWSDRAEGKIVKSSHYHLIDSAQYLVDILPPAEKKFQSFTVGDWYANLLQANAKRIGMEEAAARKAEAKVRHTRTKILRKKGNWR